MSTVTCSPGMQATGGPVLGRTGRAKSNPHPHSGLNARGKWKSRKNPFWESLPWTCPQPVPADLGAGPGSGSQRTHLFPCARPTDNSVGTRAPGQWVFQGSAQMGTGFQSISLPWMGKSHLWPKHPPENDTDGLGGGQGPQAKSLHSQPVEPLAGSGPFSAGVWAVREPRGVFSQHMGCAEPQGCCLQGPSNVPTGQVADCQRGWQMGGSPGQ